MDGLNYLKFMIDFLHFFYLEKIDGSIIKKIKGKYGVIILLT